jgi:hypothetical protein
MNDQRIFFEAPKLALTRVEAADALDVSPATLDRLLSVASCGLREPCDGLSFRLPRLRDSCAKHQRLSLYERGGVSGGCHGERGLRRASAAPAPSLSKKL